MTDAAKRTLTQETGDSSDESIGPMPLEASKPKKRKMLKHEQLYLANLPCAESYERSYMHRDVITHIVVTKTDFIITGSCDGHIKFWKKMEELIEFVKHFRSHLGPILDLSANSNGSLLCSISSDKSLKVFDVVNFVKWFAAALNSLRVSYVLVKKKPFTNGEFMKEACTEMAVREFLSGYPLMCKFPLSELRVVGNVPVRVSPEEPRKVYCNTEYDQHDEAGLCPHCAEWIHSPGDAISALALSDAGSNKLYVYDGQGTNVPLHVFERLHTKPVVIIKHNPVFEVTVSVDQAGILEYWAGPKFKYNFPKCVTFDSKLDTDLFEFAKAKTFPTGLCFSPDGKRFATLSADRKVRVFTFLTGKLNRVFDETLQRFSELQQVKQQLPNMEFGRRMAAERDLEKSDALNLANIVYDESGHFVMYSTMLGVKVVNLYTNKMVGIIGKPENLRPLKLALFQGRARRTKAAVTVEMEASENPTLDSARSDPTLFCTAFKKNRFYMFTRREPEDTKSQDADRDIFNEKPSKEDIISATEASGVERLYETAILHTALGDITIKLFGKECPRAVENFCVHSKNGYYNSHIFHRVIKGFMVQTGDPTGTGTGGRVYGGEFEDEFNSSLRHDRPYTVSMANAGPNTNGSQFFITLIPTPWLDNKHTVFGRVVKGMEVVQNISTVKTNPKTDKPYDDIQIVSITLK